MYRWVWYVPSEPISSQRHQYTTAAKFSIFSTMASWVKPWSAGLLNVICHLRDCGIVNHHTFIQTYKSRERVILAFPDLSGYAAEVEVRHAIGRENTTAETCNEDSNGENRHKDGLIPDGKRPFLDVMNR